MIEKTKAQRAAKDFALMAVSYLRMVIVIASLVAWSEREWLGLLLAIFGFGASTYLINRVVDYPDSESIRHLAEVLQDMARRRDEE
jgi:hypothetical protein